MARAEAAGGMGWRYSTISHTNHCSSAVNLSCSAALNYTVWLISMPITEGAHSMAGTLQGRQIQIPPELERVRAATLQALAGIRAGNSETKAEKNFLFTAKRTKASEQLPPHYLVYFLLVDLLGFPNLGHWEKIAWSVPLEFDDEPFLIDHRKFGIGLFARESPTAEAKAEEIISLIGKATKTAEPFYAWLAESAVSGSGLNVVNRSRQLFERFEFYLDQYKSRLGEPIESDEDHIQRVRASGSKKISDWYAPAYNHRMKCGWLGLSVIDAFFSWTEHVFIHLAVLKGRVMTGKEVAELAESNWAHKFKAALDITNVDTKTFYDKLAAIRRQFRNFNAHGAFGKQGEAFSFHSSAGAVPVRLTHKPERPAFLFGLVEEIPEAKAVQGIESFISFLRTSECAAFRYIQESDLPVILSYATDGTYHRALASVEDMEVLVDRLTHECEQAANMDW